MQSCVAPAELFQEIRKFSVLGEKSLYRSSEIPIGQASRGAAHSTGYFVLQSDIIIGLRSSL